MGKTQPPARTVRVLSVRQPFAGLIIHGPKWAENRTWQTRYRGELWIHASRWQSGEPRDWPFPTPIGAIIGRVNLIDVVEEGYAINAARRHGLPVTLEALEHVEGPVCWLLSDPRPLAEPIPMLGKLNIWTAEIPVLV